MLRRHIERLINYALKQLQAKEELLAIPAFVPIEEAKDSAQGDFTSSIALTLGQMLAMDSFEIGKSIIEHLPSSDYIERAVVSPQGIIHFYVSLYAFHAVIEQILLQKHQYGCATMGQGKKVLIEFVSANPHGLLQLSDARHAAYGVAIANLLAAVGFKTSKEYFVNDSGWAIDQLVLTIWEYYLQCCGQNMVRRANLTVDDYLKDLAKKIYTIEGSKFEVSSSLLGNVFDLKQYIELAKQLLKNNFDVLTDICLQMILTDIKTDLTRFGVTFDHWFSERKNVNVDVLNALYKRLSTSHYLKTNVAGDWLQSSRLGDKEDRQVRNEEGEYTYFLKDMAYHINKFDRGFDILLDIFRIDYQNYISGLKAAIEVAGINSERLLYLFVEGMKASADINLPATLRAMLAKYNDSDMIRFFFLYGKFEAPLEWNEAMFKENENLNPYFIIKSIYQRLKNINCQLEIGIKNLTFLQEDSEKSLIEALMYYPDVLVEAALQYKPCLLIDFLQDVAKQVENYLESEFSNQLPPELFHARGTLLLATRQVIENGLYLLGMQEFNHNPEQDAYAI